MTIITISIAKYKNNNILKYITVSRNTEQL